MTQEAHGDASLRQRRSSPGRSRGSIQSALPGVAFEIGQSPKDEVVTVPRDDFARVMEPLSRTMSDWRSTTCAACRESIT